MLGLLDTDRGVSLVTYTLSSLAIYWGCKRSVAVSTIASYISRKLAELTVLNDPRTTASRVSSIRHDQTQGSGATPTSWRGRLIFGAGVILAVGLLGVSSQLIVHLTSQKLQNRLFAITAIAQVTFGIYRVSHPFQYEIDSLSV